MGPKIRQLGLTHLHQRKPVLHGYSFRDLLRVIAKIVTIAYLILFIPTNELHPKGLARGTATRHSVRQRKTGEEVRAAGQDWTVLRFRAQGVWLSSEQQIAGVCESDRGWEHGIHLP